VSQSYLGQYPSVVINNGVDLSVFTPRPSDLRSRLGLDGKKVLLGVATAWKAEKGLQDYLSLSRYLPDDYRIVLVGVSEEQQRMLPDGVIGVTRTESQTELASYYSMADIVLNLSYQETFGMTTVEGFACGTPSIVYDKTASPELIDATCGKVVQAGNIEQLLAAIAEVTSHDKSHYAEACRRRAVTYYNKEDRFADYVQLYETLLRNA
jgi:glycosyltransferase involved in cell wall biosynthesis